MKKMTMLAVAALGVAAAIAAGCSQGATPSNTATAGNARPAANANTTTNAPPKNADDTPAQVKAAFADAQSFTTQHKDIPKGQITEIEEQADGKVPATDHHSYLAFSTAGGSRKQIGAATVVKAGGKDVVIVYENKDGSPYIKEVRADGVPAPFLAQFAGKGHDDKFLLGADLKANGVDDATAKGMVKAILIDVLTMQALYGASHSH